MKFKKIISIIISAIITVATTPVFSSPLSHNAFNAVAEIDLNTTYDTWEDAYKAMTDEERAEKKETNEELERLRKMVESIGGKAAEEQTEEPAKEEAPAENKNNAGVPDLAALAAQAAALKKK